MDTFFENADRFLTVVGLITCVVSLFGWFRLWSRERHLGRRVTIHLVDAENPKRVVHPIEHKPRRADLSRSEIQGILGAATGGKDYKIAFLRSEKFLPLVESVVHGNSDLLEIPVTEEEVAPFKN
ncbi:MAG: hypothetical protein H7A52_00420 [Akkermansiaceae bacterium]|nr:hypothetical protein [Akkermansiaceae bacterium]